MQKHSCWRQQFADYTQAQPSGLLVENVVGFNGSDVHAHLAAALAACGYHTQVRVLGNCCERCTVSVDQWVCDGVGLRLATCGITVVAPTEVVWCDGGRCQGVPGNARVLTVHSVVAATSPPQREHALHAAAISGGGHVAGPVVSCLGQTAGSLQRLAQLGSFMWDYVQMCNSTPSCVCVTLCAWVVLLPCLLQEFLLTPLQYGVPYSRPR